jgi:hypothetical protein
VTLKIPNPGVEKLDANIKSVFFKHLQEMLRENLIIRV